MFPLLSASLVSLLTSHYYFSLSEASSQSSSIDNDIGISFTSWDSIAEVVALAMNFTPTEHLRNTCAGITELHIFKLPVRILVKRDTDGEGEHLELVFGQASEKEIDKNAIQVNRAYGSMAKIKSQ